jgi:CheY-like chemotaxis protein
MEEEVLSPVAMHLLIDDALKLLRPAIPRTIAISTRIKARCHVLGDPSRLHRIILNLCTNAYQAMADSGGKLDILLAEEGLTGEAAAVAHLLPGRYAKPAKQRLIGGSERILLIDDEPDILEIEKEMLEKLGYAVTGTTHHAPEALDGFARQPDRFDLVITDMTMPRMTGVDLAAELRKQRKDIPVLLCTGFSESMSAEKAGALGIKEFLMKPVSMQNLARCVRRRLDRSSER